MPPARWPLRKYRPSIEVRLPQSKGKKIRSLLADTGAGSDLASFELILRELDCVRSGGVVIGDFQLEGAYSGTHVIYSVAVQIRSLSFADEVLAVRVHEVLSGFDGMACFRFLNRFHYGNFGDAALFGLE